MIAYSIIQKSHLEGALRLDAEYYQPEYLSIFSKIASLAHTSLKSYAEKVFSGPFGSTLKSESYRESGIPFIRISDISDLFIEKDGLVFISPEEHKRIYSTHLNTGDIVLSKIGTIGRLSVVSDDFGEVNISENNIGIRLSKCSKEEKIALLFFLLSKYGQGQIIRKASGNIQLKLNITDIESVQVPIFDKATLKELNDIYNDFLLRNTESQSFYSQAENLLLEELGLKNFSARGGSAFGGESEDGLWNVVKLLEVQKANRIDAEYFQNKYNKIVSLIRAKKGIKLGELVSIKKGIEPGAEEYQDDGKLFIRVSSLSKQGITDKDQKYLSDKLYQELKKDFEPKTGEILLTKDATPGIAYVLKESLEGIIAGGVLRLRVKEDVNAEYLALCINSIVGQAQAERDAGGSIIAHWKPEQIKNILIPILPKSIQQKIADFVRQSHEARRKAKKLLESAKQKVEKLIEEK